jgi:hypothetical protein
VEEGLVIAHGLDVYGWMFLVRVITSIKIGHTIRCAVPYKRTISFLVTLKLYLTDLDERRFRLFEGPETSMM